MDILNDMLTLADIHSKLALEDKNLKNVSQNLRIVKQAIEIACFLKPQSSTDSKSDLLIELFLASISHKLERASCYRLYVDICQEYEVEPLRKSAFFSVLKDENFQTKATNKGIYIVPPVTTRLVGTTKELKSEFSRRLQSSPKSGVFGPLRIANCISHEIIPETPEIA
jgi:hypothetical protein